MMNRFFAIFVVYYYLCNAASSHLCEIWFWFALFSEQDLKRGERLNCERAIWEFRVAPCENKSHDLPVDVCRCHSYPGSSL